MKVPVADFLVAFLIKGASPGTLASFFPAAVGGDVEQLP